MVMICSPSSSSFLPCGPLHRHHHHHLFTVLILVVVFFQNQSISIIHSSIIAKKRKKNELVLHIAVPQRTHTLFSFWMILSHSILLFLRQTPMNVPTIRAVRTVCAPTFQDRISVRAKRDTFWPIHPIRRWAAWTTMSACPSHCTVLPCVPRVHCASTRRATTTVNVHRAPRAMPRSSVRTSTSVHPSRPPVASMRSVPTRQVAMCARASKASRAMLTCPPAVRMWTSVVARICVERTRVASTWPDRTSATAARATAVIPFRVASMWTSVWLGRVDRTPSASTHWDRSCASVLTSLWLVVARPSWAVIVRRWMLPVQWPPIARPMLTVPTGFASVWRAIKSRAWPVSVSVLWVMDKGLDPANLEHLSLYFSGHDADVNECNKKNICGAHGTCSNTIGSYECSCQNGYTKVDANLATSKCIDIDECSVQGTGLCGPNAQCVNVDGHYKCVCHKGFIGNGTEGCKCKFLGFRFFVDTYGL